MSKKSILGLIILLQVITINAQEQLTVSALFSDGIVLQQKSKSPIWGWGNPGEKVEVSGSWGKRCKTTIDKSGKWVVKLKTPKFGGPYSISIKNSENVISINDVLIGEVWICSGQSNMDMPLKGNKNDPILNSEEEIENANYPNIRMFSVARGHTIYPQKDVKGSWQKATPENAPDFSAVAYFFGRELYRKLKIPIGLLHTSFGGSPAEAWLPKEDLIDLPRFKNLDADISKIKENIEAYDAWIGSLKVANNVKPRDLFTYNEEVICDEAYRKPSYNDNQWSVVDMPSKWLEIGARDYNGIIWYRKQFVLSELDENQSSKIILGKIDDVDECYINGVLVGKSYSWADRKKERSYTIPKGILKNGTNIMAIRVADSWKEGGFVSEQKPVIQQGGKTILEIHKNWKYKPTAEFINWKLRCFDEDKFSFKKKPYLPFIVEQGAPTALYNYMINPVVPYKAKGFIWYQGESNTGNPKEYKPLFTRLVKRWRDDWDNKKMPFYYAQIAPLANYDKDEGKNTAELREVQFLTQQINNTGMAVLLDLGDQWQIHPHRKQEVGKRLAAWALHKDYRKKTIPFSGPTMTSATYKDGKAILSFAHIESGLELRQGDKNLFQISGEDGVFYPAKTKVINNKLMVWSDKVIKPTQVRYAFINWVEKPTLYNKAGLPASSFRTN